MKYVVACLLDLMLSGCVASQPQPDRLVLISLSSPTPTSVSVPAQRPQTITGKVVAIADGDTLTVLDDQKRQHEIQLDGIDAPESNQNFGEKAKQSLSGLVRGKTVTVTGSKVDSSGRIVGKVTLDGKDINLEQIRRGYAWFYRQRADELSRIDARMYELAEADARDNGRGLWAEPGPIPPWELRAAQRSEPNGGGQIIGNRNRKLYYLPNCPDYSKVSERDRVLFATEGEAVTVGYRKARNCP